MAATDQRAATVSGKYRKTIEGDGAQKPATRMTATARSVEGTLRQEIDVNGRHTISTDEPERLGGGDSAPTPHELLPAMLASCVSTMIVIYARRRDWSLEDVRVDVGYDPQSSPRRVKVAIQLPDGLTPQQVERLRRVAETCPVKRALEAGFTFEQEVEFRSSTATDLR